MMLKKRGNVSVREIILWALAIAGLVAIFIFGYLIKTDAFEKFINFFRNIF